jgi:hypothetical protein
VRVGQALPDEIRRIRLRGHQFVSRSLTYWTVGSAGMQGAAPRPFATLRTLRLDESATFPIETQSPQRRKVPQSYILPQPVKTTNVSCALRFTLGSEIRQSSSGLAQRSPGS